MSWRDRDFGTMPGINRQKEKILDYWKNRPDADQYEAPMFTVLGLGGRYSRLDLRSNMVNGCPPRKKD